MKKWRLIKTELFARSFKKYQKKHQPEVIAVLNNLDTYLKTLQAGVKSVLVHAGFIHLEPLGVIAIDQKGMKGKGRQTRLYVYTVEIDKVVYLITIGDKNSQKSDIVDCKKFVTDLRKKNEKI